MSQDGGMAVPVRRDAFSTLRQFVRPRAVQERCDLCSTELAPDHQHLLEPVHRQLLCACDACALLFSGQADQKYRRVPRRVRFLPDFRLADAQWDNLLIPVGMAFFFHNTPAARVMAFYPSPAGATESMLNLESWQEIVRDNPILEKMEPDVEALLVNRLQGTQEYYMVPVDKCYELVGLIRTYWRGLSGGSEVWEEIRRFYAKLKEQSGTLKTPGEESRA
jgi:hypothetical protein